MWYEEESVLVVGYEVGSRSVTLPELLEYAEW